MMKVMVMCLGGFSSSALVNHLNQEAKEKGLDTQVEFLFPRSGRNRFDPDNMPDLVMLCPHMAMYAKQLVSAHPDIPFYIIPTRLYGMMAAEELFEDAEDVMAGWKETGMNPFHFEGEAVAIRIKRSVSHRKWLKTQQ